MVNLLSLFLILVSTFIIWSPPSIKTNNAPLPTFTPTPTPYQFPYKNPSIPKNRSYKIAIIGDSIVYSLGINANVLREYLIKYYPENEFVTYNYGYPSTNVLSLYSRLTDVVLKEDVDLIIIESFGNNPLSQYPLAEGLIKQTEELEKSVRLILSQKPNVSLAFLTPIALDPIHYARGSRDLSPEVRKQWVDERNAYISNHKKFAAEKGIPLIDVSTLSLKPNGQVNQVYISPDAIHPSASGIDFISKSIADYIFQNKIFPN